MNISNSEKQIKSSISNFKEEIVTNDELLKEQKNNNKKIKNGLREYLNCF